MSVWWPHHHSFKCSRETPRQTVGQGLQTALCKNTDCRHWFHQTKAALSRSIRTPKRCHSPWWIHISWVVSKHASTAPPFQDISWGSISWRDTTNPSTVTSKDLLNKADTQTKMFTFGLVMTSTLSTRRRKEGGILLMMRWSRNSWAPWNISPPPTTRIELYIFRLVSSDAVKQTGVVTAGQISLAYSSTNFSWHSKSPHVSLKPRSHWEDLHVMANFGQLHVWYNKVLS